MSNMDGRRDMKTYRVTLPTGCYEEVGAYSAQEACALLGWPISGCSISEIPLPRLSMDPVDSSIDSYPRFSVR